MFKIFHDKGINPPYQSKSKYATNYQTGRPRNDGEPVKPYSQMHCNLLYNVTDRYYEDCIIQPKSEADERGAALDYDILIIFIFLFQDFLNQFLLFQYLFQSHKFHFPF